MPEICDDRGPVKRPSQPPLFWGQPGDTEEACGRPKRIIVQVKSGHVNRGMIATLKGDMEREKAEIGVFITLQPSTEPMRQAGLV